MNMNAHFTKLFKVTEGNQAFVVWGDLDTTFIYIHLLVFFALFGSGSIVQLSYYTDHMQRSFDSFSGN